MPKYHAKLHTRTWHFLHDTNWYYDENTHTNHMGYSKTHPMWVIQKENVPPSLVHPLNYSTPRVSSMDYMHEYKRPEC